MVVRLYATIICALIGGLVVVVAAVKTEVNPQPSAAFYSPSPSPSPSSSSTPDAPRIVLAALPTPAGPAPAPAAPDELAQKPPVLQPGDGFADGPTPAPPAIAGQGPGADAQAIARWDVVPHQSFDGDDDPMIIGVVAFHMNRIDRVEFSVEGGPWTPVRRMTRNPRTGAAEYCAALRADSFKSSGAIEVRAIAYPTTGVPRLLKPLPLNVRRPEDRPGLVRYVSPAGDDRHGDGSEQRPYQSIYRAALAIQDESGFQCADHGLIYLMAGEHAYGPPDDRKQAEEEDDDDEDENAANDDGADAVVATAAATTAAHAPATTQPAAKSAGANAGDPPAARSPYSRALETRDAFLTISAAPGLARENVRLTSGGRIDASLVHVRGVTIHGAKLSSTRNIDALIWLDDCTLSAANKRDDVNFVSRSQWKGGIYVTDCDIRDVRNGLSGARLMRNVKVSNTLSDAMSNCHMVVNCSVDGIDKGKTDEHPDVLQWYIKKPLDNVIIYGLTATNAGAQGIFVSGDAPVSNVAFVNVLIEMANHSYLNQWRCSADHLLFWNVSLVNRPLVFRHEKIRNLSIRDSVFFELRGVDFRRFPDAASNNHFVKGGGLGAKFTLGDPQWTDEQRSDYRPAPGSPLRGRVRSPLVPQDALGTTMSVPASVGAIQPRADDTAVEHGAPPAPSDSP